MEEKAVKTEEKEEETSRKSKTALGGIAATPTQLPTELPKRKGKYQLTTEDRRKGGKVKSEKKLAHTRLANLQHGGTVNADGKKWLEDNQVQLCKPSCPYRPCSAYRPGYPCKVKIDSVKRLSKLAGTDADAINELYNQVVETLQMYRVGMESETRKRDFMIYAKELNRMLLEFAKIRFGEKHKVELQGKLATINLADMWDRMRAEKKRKKVAC